MPFTDSDASYLFEATETKEDLADRNSPARFSRFRPGMDTLFLRLLWFALAHLGPWVFLPHDQKEMTVATYKRRFRNQRNRKKTAQGLIVVIACAIGGIAGGWGGAAIGFLLSGVLVTFIDHSPNP
jgi:hypothetical protein